MAYPIQFSISLCFNHFHKFQTLSFRFLNIYTKTIFSNPIIMTLRFWGWLRKINQEMKLVIWFIFVYILISYFLGNPWFAVRNKRFTYWNPIFETIKSELQHHYSKFLLDVPNLILLIIVHPIHHQIFLRITTFSFYFYCLK